MSQVRLDIKNYDEIRGKVIQEIGIQKNIIVDRDKEIEALN